MKFAVTSRGQKLSDPMDARFGRADYLLICEDEKVLKVIENMGNKSQAHGVGPVTASKLEGEGIEVLITGNGPGGNAKRVLQELGIKVFVGAMDMSGSEAFAAYKDGKLKEF